jgi:hypothetical protein
MSAIMLAELSASDAENALVQIWLLLEKHQIASPEVVVVPVSNRLSDRLRIRLIFASRRDAEVVRLKLGDWARQREAPIP